jgi:ornithine carbamoyltransferase
MADSGARSLLTVGDLDRKSVETLWSSVGTVSTVEAALPVACSFQGTGVRTRTTFLRALALLRIPTVGLPGLLESRERPQDLAGYLDVFYSLYVVRHQDHQRLAAFAEASSRPVINAMSSHEHPCEALADGYWFETYVRPLSHATILLWGPATNVLRSWASLCTTFSASVHQHAPADLCLPVPRVSPPDLGRLKPDMVVTDSWPSGFLERRYSLSLRTLEALGNPLLLPTPPFTIGEELAFDPLTYPGFVGYRQKEWLLPVQQAVVAYFLTQATVGSMPSFHLPKNSETRRFS